MRACLAQALVEAFTSQVQLWLICRWRDHTERWCCQWKFTADQSFPASYWNCVNSDTTLQPARERTPASTGQGITKNATRTLLANHHVNIFVFPSSTEESLFVSDLSIPNRVGFTFPGEGLVSQSQFRAIQLFGL